MGDGFGQSDRPVHRMNVAAIRLDGARLPAVGTLDRRRLIGGDVARSCGLNHLTQPLLRFVGGNLDLIVMRRPRPLLDGLNLASHVGGPFENFGEFLFEFDQFRIQAFLLETYPTDRTAPSLTHRLQNLLLTFPIRQNACNP